MGRSAEPGRAKAASPKTRRAGRIRGEPWATNRASKSRFRSRIDVRREYIRAGGARRTALEKGAPLFRDVACLRADLLAHPDCPGRRGARAGPGAEVRRRIPALRRLLLDDRFALPDLGG